MFSLVLFTLLFSLDAKNITFGEFITFTSKVLSIAYVAPFMPSIASPGVVSKTTFLYILLESITDAGRI